MSQANQSGLVDGNEGSYCKVSEAIKLVTCTFEGDKHKLREFIDNVDTAFEITDPNNHALLLKFVKAKITGEARSKLIIKALTTTWESIRTILEDNYSIRRTIDFYACQMFNAKQGAQESIVAWASRLDGLQTQFKEAAARSCEVSELGGAVSLIFMMGRACFTQGLYSERIQTIVRSRDAKMNFSQCVEVALEEESALMSNRDKGTHSNNHRKDNKPVLKCYGCGKQGHIAAQCFQKKRTLPVSVRTVNQEGRGKYYSGQAGNGHKGMECHYCKKVGHFLKDCFKRKRDIALKEQKNATSQNTLNQ